MKALENASLKGLNTFGVEASAKLLLTIETEEDLLTLPAFDSRSDLVLGGGSNVLFATNIPGTAFLNRITGREIIEEHDDQVLIEVGSGEVWHDLVLWSLSKGLSGLENLSLIPGLAGAAPIQNIGAYGVELSSVLEGVTAWDWQKARWEVFSKDECRLAYRDSRFKSIEPGRYLITSVRLRLSRRFIPHLEYQGLGDDLLKMGIERPDPGQVSEAVMRIRKRKLPDPTRLANAGSFFKNPIIAKDEALALRQKFPGLPGWPSDSGLIKLSAGWMIEHCGLKGIRHGDVGVSERHSLVLVNYGSATGRQIAFLANSIRKTVFEEFGVQLDQEPVLVDFQTNT
jgi:UDP-N-acetylmuramate dehydrogenase